jgi:hypothetical protein
MDSTLTLALFKSRQVQAKSLAELVSLIKANPDKFNFSSRCAAPGGRAVPHGRKSRYGARALQRCGLVDDALSMRNSLMQLVRDAGFRAEAARDGPALTDIAAGQVQLTFTTFTSAQALLAAKRVDAVVVANRKRLAVMPDMPTFEKAGIKGMEIGTMNGLLVPAGTPPAVVVVVARIYAALAVIVVGAGNAALCAAISAAEAGVSVPVLERAPQANRGGNSAFSGGAFRVAYDGIDDISKLVPDLSQEDADNTDFGTYPRGRSSTS